MKKKERLNEHTKVTLTIGQIKRLIQESRLTLEDDRADDEYLDGIDTFVKRAEEMDGVKSIDATECKLDDEYHAFKVVFTNGFTGHYEIRSAYLRPDGELGGEVFYTIFDADGNAILGEGNSSVDLRVPYILDWKRQMLDEISILERGLHKAKINAGKARAKLRRNYYGDSFGLRFDVEKAEGNVDRITRKLNKYKAYLRH